MRLASAKPSRRDGNYVSQEFHYLSDAWRYPPSWQAFGPKLVQTFPREETLGSLAIRIPWVNAGAGAGATAGGAGFLPEVELALREGKLGPHVRRVVIPRRAPLLTPRGGVPRG